MPDPVTMGLGTAAVTALIGGLAGSLPFMLGAGQPSEAEQERMLRRQLEIQDEFEQRRAGRAGGDPLAGLVGGGAAPSMSELLGEDAILKQVAEAAYKLDRARSQRSKHLDELGDILAGQHARIAALQSERVMSPLEIIQMMESIGG